MGRPEKVVAVAGLAIAVGGGAMSGFAPTLFPQYAAFGFWGGLFVLAAGALATAWALIRRDPAEIAESHLGDSYNNSGNNFGHMGPIHIGQPAFELTQDHVNQVLRQLIHGRPVIVQAIGNRRAWAMGDAMTRAIHAAGHHAVQRNIGMLVPAPDGPLTVSHEGNATCVTIAPSA